MAITPYLYYEDVGGAMKFLAKAFGFRKHGRQMLGPKGKINHAAMRFGGSHDYDGEPSNRLSQP